MARSMAKFLSDGFHEPLKVAAKPSTAYPSDDVPLSPAWTTSVIPLSSSRDQNGSKRSSNGEHRPVAVVGAAARMTINRAPAPIAHSSSSTAHDGSASDRYGAAKMRS